MSVPGRGKVITFYSYKGGTGRSQALANVAWILASNGRRVLAIDWDLEAPGLHRYFAPFLFDASVAETDGLIEFVLEYADKALQTTTREDSEPWYQPLADISRYAISVDYAFEEGGAIDLVPAGRQGSFYADRVRSFDWHNFYNRLRGGAFLEETRARFVEDYHYILIDSRTGVSDTSGICTAQLPDVLVACFTANNQSIDGTAAVAASARRQPRPRAEPALLLPLMTRVDNSEKQKLTRRRALARLEFDKLLPREWGTAEREAYWGAAQVPYIPFYAYEEILAPFDDQPGDAASMLTAMERLTEAVTGGDIKRLGVRPTPKERLEIQAKYAQHKSLPPETPEPAASEAVYDVYLSFRNQDRAIVRQIAERLRDAGVRFFFDEWHMQPGRKWQDELTRALGASAACVIFVGEDFGAWQTLEAFGSIAQRLATSSGRFRVIPAILPGSGAARLPDILRDINPVDFNVDPSRAYERLLDSIRGIAPSPVPSADTCPYKGFEPFDVKDARLFFGREDLVRQMIEDLRRVVSERGKSRLFGIVGATGSGKSSLARAGVLEALRRGELKGSELWPLVVFRPGFNPLESLAVALSRIPEFSQNPAFLKDLLNTMASSREALHLALRVALSTSASVSSDRRAVLLVDQIEEVFALCRDEALRLAFLDNLLYAAQAESGSTVVIFTARDDLDLSSHPLFASASQDQPYFRTGLLGREDIRRAIEKPAECVGLSVEPALVNLLLRDVHLQPGGLSLLQLTLKRLWEHREDSTLTARAYQAIGGVTGLLFSLAEDAYGRLNPADQQIFRDILLTLASFGPHHPASLVRLETASSQPSQVDALVGRMVDERLLAVERDSPESAPVIVPAHQSLVRDWPRLLIWEREREAPQLAREETTHSRPGQEAAFATTAVKPTLVVYAVWHPRWSEGGVFAGQIYSRFARDVSDPLARGIGIPVYFRSEPASPEVMTPAPIALDDAQQTAVIVFVSSHMVVDEPWMSYLRDLIKEAAGSENRHRVLPVAVSPSALRSDQFLSRMNFIRLYDFPDDNKTQRLLGILTSALGRLLIENPGAGHGGDRTRLFLSHSKRDGTRLVEAIAAAPMRQALDLEIVADDVSYVDWDEWLEGSLKGAIFVALVTDSYSSRAWCRSEVLAAKRSGVPMVVVDALDHIEPRAFPYLGNVPTIRWTGTNAQEVIDLAVQESLRLLHVRARFGSLREIGRIPAGAHVLSRPPELLDCGQIESGDVFSTGAVVIYPDPPLDPQELEVLSRHRPDIAFVTPTGADRQQTLANLRVGLSLSEPEDLNRRGLGTPHLEDALVELVRHLTAQGASLAYGGDLRSAGITELLVDVMRTHRHGRRRIANYLAWPIHLELDLESRASLIDVADYHFIPPPSDLVATLGLDPTRPLELSSSDPPSRRYILARCLTAMRHEMIGSCGAVLALGGRQSNFLGKYPGIVEEAYTALCTGKPLFLFGGFGGGALAVIDALHGRALRDMRDENPVEAKFIEYYNERIVADSKLGECIDYSRLSEFFAAKGVDGLNNGLTIEENGRLFRTVYLEEAIFLLLTGLKRLSERGPSVSPYYGDSAFGTENSRSMSSDN
jgi:cellulose biosynthesis protein BcsQ